MEISRLLGLAPPTQVISTVSVSDKSAVLTVETGLISAFTLNLLLATQIIKFVMMFASGKLNHRAVAAKTNSRVSRVIINLTQAIVIVVQTIGVSQGWRFIGCEFVGHK